MNSRSPNTVTAALREFQEKTVYFHTYNVLISIWASLALIYYVVNTIDISSCTTLRYYFIFWSITYGLQIFVPIVCVSSVRSGRNFPFAYFCILFEFILKVLVMGSLLAGAWNGVGSCFIPSPYKQIILITNAVEAMCLLIDYVLIYRIKAVNRQILINRLVTEKTFAEN